MPSGYSRQYVAICLAGSRRLIIDKSAANAILRERASL